MFFVIDLHNATSLFIGKKYNPMSNSLIMYKALAGYFSGRNDLVTTLAFIVLSSTDFNLLSILFRLRVKSFGFVIKFDSKRQILCINHTFPVT